MPRVDLVDENGLVLTIVEFEPSSVCLIDVIDKEEVCLTWAEFEQLVSEARKYEALCNLFEEGD